MRLFSPAGREVATRFPAGRPGLSVRRSDLDPRLAAQSGAEVVRGVAATRVEKGRVALADGREFRAKVIVGADGRNSVVAAQSGLRAAPRCKPRATLHAYYENVPGCTRSGEMHLPGTRTYVGLNPGPDGLVNVTCVLDLEALGPSPKPRARVLLDEALASIPSLAARFAAARPATEVRILAPLEVRTRRVYGDGVLLAGDAAAFRDPLTGEGMYRAIVSGELAGRHAARAALHGAPLASYARAYRGAFGTKVVLQRLFEWLVRQPRLLEALGGRLARRPWLGDALIGLVGNVVR
jgi:flavin-dependent dehydrogenase